MGLWSPYLDVGIPLDEVRIIILDSAQSTVYLGEYLGLRVLALGSGWLSRLASVTSVFPYKITKCNTVYGSTYFTVRCVY